MSDQLKDFTSSPTLVFDPAPQPKNPPAEEIKEVPAMDDSILTEEEKKMVDDFSSQIDLHNTNGILQYGAGTQKKMADFSEAALNNVRTKDLGEEIGRAHV